MEPVYVCRETGIGYMILIKISSTVTPKMKMLDIHVNFINPQKTFKTLWVEDRTQNRGIVLIQHTR